MHPTAKAARVAGAVYLSMAITAPFSMIYVPHTLVVKGDAAATAVNILSHETMFRLGIVAELLTSAAFIFVGLAFYRLFRGVSKSLASALVALVLVSSAVGFINVLNNVAAVTLIRGADFLSVFSKDQLYALGTLFLGLHRQGNVINEIFWGLWLFPFGALVMRSRFLPWFLGAWLIANGFAYLAPSFAGLLWPHYETLVTRVVFPALFGEVAIMLWLLIKGANVGASVGAGPRYSP